MRSSRTLTIELITSMTKNDFVDEGVNQSKKKTEIAVVGNDGIKTQSSTSMIRLTIVDYL